MPAEFIEKISDSMIRVKRQDFPSPVGAIVRHTRLPAKQAKGATPRDADDPFATQDERSTAGAMRTWSDASGKFKVQAQLLRIEGEQIVLRRDDDKEITVAIEKFTTADKAYIEDVHSGKIKLAPDRGHEDGADDATGEPAVKITATDLNQATTISISGGEPWSYRPDQRMERDVLKPTRVKLEGGDFADRAERVLFMPKEKKAFVVVVNSGHGGQTCRLQAGMLAPEFAPLDISPDGASLVARCEAFGLGKQAELRIYKRDGGSAKLVVAWLPYRHHAQPGARLRGGSAEDSAERPELGPAADVTWAVFVDSSHLLSLSRHGELALWETPTLKPVYMVKVQHMGPPALSATRKYLSVATSAGVAILQTADGRVAGVLPGKDLSTGAFAFRDDGRRLAMRQGYRLSVWDLEHGALVRDFQLDVAAGSSSSIAWADNEHILTGTQLVDVERRVTICTYRQLGTAWAVRDGVVWFVARGVGPNDKVLASGEAVPKAALEAARHLNPDEMFAIKPGVEVAVELPARAQPTATTSAPRSCTNCKRLRSKLCRKATSDSWARYNRARPSRFNIAPSAIRSRCRFRRLSKC